MFEFAGVIQELVRLLKPKVYVEVGVQFGRTFCKMAPLVERAIAVDMKVCKFDLPANSEYFHMSSFEFIKKWKGKIDFLLIDANHDKKYVLDDFDGLAPWLSETGLIFLHDTYPVEERLLDHRQCSNAWEAAREIHKSEKYKDYEIVTFPGPKAGLSIIRHAEPHLKWRK